MPSLTRHVVMTLIALLMALGPVLGLTPLGSLPTAQAFYPGETHIPLFRETLMSASDRKFDPAFARFVEAGLGLSDTTVGQLHWEWHFDSAKNPVELCQRWAAGPEGFLQSMEKLAVEAFRRDPKDPAGFDRIGTNRQAALTAYGQYLHAIQDFYSHTNLIELAQAKGEQAVLAPIQKECIAKNLDPKLQSGFFDATSPPATLPHFCGAATDAKGLPIPPPGFDYCHGPPRPEFFWPRNRMDVGLMLSKDLPNLYHGTQKFKLPDGRETSYYAEARRLGAEATTATWQVLHDRVVAKLGAAFPGRDPECLFRVLTLGGNPGLPCSSSRTYQGTASDKTIAIEVGEDRTPATLEIGSVTAEIVLKGDDQAGYVVDSGSLDYAVKKRFPNGVQMESIKSSSAVGSLTSFPGGGWGRVQFTGPITMQWESNPPQTFATWQETFDLALDKNGQLVLCPAWGDKERASPQDASKHCLDHPIAVLVMR
jgi:hypothetical protein